MPFKEWHMNYISLTECLIVSANTEVKTKYNQSRQYSPVDNVLYQHQGLFRTLDTSIIKVTIPMSVIAVSACIHDILPIVSCSEIYP